MGCDIYSRRLEQKSACLKLSRLHERVEEGREADESMMLQARWAAVSEAAFEAKLRANER
jgi:hypothetical protein